MPAHSPTRVNSYLILNERRHPESMDAYGVTSALSAGSGAEQRISMPITNSYFELHADYGTREITISGEFDAGTAPCLTTAVSRLHNAARGDITILLHDVTFIDVAGIGAVASARKAQLRNGARLDVIGASDDVRRVFSLGGLTDLLPAR